MSHVILVFGCPAYPDGRPRPPLERRLQAALLAARADPHAQLILSGGAVVGPCEAHCMVRWLVERGVDPARCHPEPEARNTRENAELGLAMAQALGASRLSLVSESYHLPRAHHWVRRVLDNRRWRLEVVRVSTGGGGTGLARRFIERIKHILLLY